MASVFDPNIDTRGAASSFRVEQPVQDTVTPQLAGLITKGVMHVAKESAITDLTGDGRMAAEAAADPALLTGTSGTTAEQEAALKSIDTLSKLASARKAGLPIGQARTRATAILKRAVNDNPSFSNDVREAYNKFFGGTGSGIFDLTPEEKAMEDYRERVTTRSLDLNIPVEEAAKSVRTEQSNKLYLQELELEDKERTLTGDGFASYAQVNTTMNVDAFTQDVIAKVKKQGSLTAEDVQSYKAKAISLQNQLKAQQNKLLMDDNGQIRIGFVDRASIDAANKLIDDQIKNLTALLDDQSALKLSADNYGILNNNYNTLMIKHFPEYKVLKDVLGEQGASFIYQNMLGNKQYVNVLKNDPLMKSIFAQGDLFTQDLLGRKMNALATATGKSDKPLETADKAAWLGVLGDGFNNQLAIISQQPGNKVGELTRQAFEIQPNAIAMFKQPQWSGAIDKDPMVQNAFNEALTGAAKGLRQQLVSELDTFDLSDVRITLGQPIQSGPLGFRFEAPSVINVSGNVSNGFTARVKEMYDLVNKHPVVWKGKADSAIEYVNQLIKLPSATAQQPVSQTPTKDDKQIAAERFAAGELSLEQLQEILGMA